MFLRPYTSSVTPAYILFIIERSSIMGEIYQNSTSKADYVTNEVNHFINELIFRCASGDRVKDWFFISVIGHSDDNAYEIRSDYLSNWADNPLRIDVVKRKVSDGVGGLIEIEQEYPIHISPISVGKENLLSSFEFAKDLVVGWKQKKDYISTLIINISGQYNDNWRETTRIINELKKISDNKETPILFNLFLSKNCYLEFPSLDKVYDKSFANQLFFEWSSYLSEEMINSFRKYEFDARKGAKLFSNKGLSNLINLIPIGS